MNTRDCKQLLDKLIVWARGHPQADAIVKKLQRDTSIAYWYIRQVSAEILGTKAPISKVSAQIFICAYCGKRKTTIEERTLCENACYPRTHPAPAAQEAAAAAVAAAKSCAAAAKDPKHELLSKTQMLSLANSLSIDPNFGKDEVAGSGTVAATTASTTTTASAPTATTNKPKSTKSTKSTKNKKTAAAAKAAKAAIAKAVGAKAKGATDKEVLLSTGRKKTPSQKMLLLK